MDVALYIKLQQLLPLSKRPDRPRDGPFSPFEPITIKLLMSCPMSQFVYLPLCDWFEAIFNVSPLATPNTISIIGLFLGMSRPAHGCLQDCFRKIFWLGNFVK